MSKEHENFYKICRNNRKITVEKAAGSLNISTHTLYDYESGRAKVPDDIVDKMCEVYDAPILGWWHLKNTSALGKYLPEVFMPKTGGDVLGQLSLAGHKLPEVMKTMQDILWDGIIDENEKTSYGDAIEVIKQISAKLLSVTIWNSDSQ